MVAKKKSTDLVKPKREAVKQAKNRTGGAPQLDPYKFKPGQSGNPAGRPKRRTLSERIDDLLNGDKLEGFDVPAGSCVADVLAEAILKQACKGNFPFAKEVFDRIEGKVAERLAGHDGGPLNDLSGLTDNDLDALTRISGKLAPGRPGGLPPGR